MSMLRRPYDHHRDIPARRDPAPSADRSNDQDRHFMMAPVPRCNALALFAGSRPAGTTLGRISGCPVKPHSSAHPAVHSKPASPQPTPRIASYSITRTIGGTQIPIARDEPPSLPSRGFLPWRFSDAGHPCAWHLRQRPASENLHRTRLMHRTNSPQEVSRITWKCRLTTGRKTGTIHPFSVFVSTRSSLTPDMA